MKLHATLRSAIAFAPFCLALAPPTATADPQQGRQACFSDAMTVCGQFIPDRERVASCLIANRSRISLDCRNALKRFKPRTAAR
jgi:hypothetical protein